MRSEAFGELAFVDHGMVDVEGGKKKLVFSYSSTVLRP